MDEKREKKYFVESERIKKEKLERYIGHWSYLNENCLLCPNSKNWKRLFIRYKSCKNALEFGMSN